MLWPLEDGRLRRNSRSASSPDLEHGRSPPVSTLAPSLPADVDIGEDLLELIARGLGADHGRGIERAALHDLLGRARRRRSMKRVVDLLAAISAQRGQVQTSPWLRANMREALERLVEELVVGRP